jgi:hypothetical protein
MTMVQQQAWPGLGRKAGLLEDRHAVLAQPWVDALLARVRETACRELRAGGLSVAEEQVTRLVHLPAGVLCRYVASPARAPMLTPAPVFLVAARLALVAAPLDGAVVACEMSLTAHRVDAPAGQYLVCRPLAHVPLAEVPMSAAELEAVLTGVLLGGPAGMAGGFLRVQVRRFVRELGLALQLPPHALTVRTPALHTLAGPVSAPMPGAGVADAAARDNNLDLAAVA